ncbi:hypothetical protein LZ023_35920 (plasmid) [Pseudomonas silvicola]|nr:hypothetical protein LZ023_35920 [Pseudomonas silvicola]
MEVFEFIDGWRAFVKLDFQQSAIRHRALQGLKSFNDQPLLRQNKTVFDMLNEHIEQVSALNVALSADAAWLHKQAQRAQQALEAAGLDLVPCMNDTLAGNFMLNAQRTIFAWSILNMHQITIAVMNWRCGLAKCFSHRK